MRKSKSKEMTTEVADQIRTLRPLRGLPIKAILTACILVIPYLSLRARNTKRGLARFQNHPSRYVTDVGLRAYRYGLRELTTTVRIYSTHRRSLPQLR